MFVDTDAIRAFGAACSAHADDLSPPRPRLTSTAGCRGRRAFGPVGARFLAALADAAAGREARSDRRAERRLAAAHSSRRRRRGGVRRRRPTRQPGSLALAMPSALVAALAAPIREVPAQVGPGWSGDRRAIRPPRSPGCATAGRRLGGRRAAAGAGRAESGRARVPTPRREFAATTVAADRRRSRERIDELRRDGRQRRLGGRAGPRTPAGHRRPLRRPRGRARAAPGLTRRSRRSCWQRRGGRWTRRSPSSRSCAPSWTGTPPRWRSRRRPPPRRRRHRRAWRVRHAGDGLRPRRRRRPGGHAVGLGRRPAAGSATCADFAEPDAPLPDAGRGSSATAWRSGCPTAAP